MSLVVAGHSSFLMSELMTEISNCGLFDVGTLGCFSGFFFLFLEPSPLLWYIYSHLKINLTLFGNCFEIVLPAGDPNFSNFIKTGWKSWHCLGKMRKINTVSYATFPGKTEYL